MVIWLDFVEGEDSFKAEVTKEKPKFVSAPYVKDPINSSDVEISGSFYFGRDEKPCGNFECRRIACSP